MSRRESKVEQNYIDTEFSSGDTNHKSKQLYQEENNNEIDELSKDLSAMGCIVDAVKRPPNICVENCVYESDSDESIKEENVKNEEDHYSDEFEEDKSVEDESVKIEAKASQSHSDSSCRQGQFMKLSKSQSFMSSKPVSISGKSSSTNYGSISIPPTRRINMSFTNDRLREIERHNHILLNKILSARNSRKSSIPAREPSAKRAPVPSAAVHRKKQQRQIDHENMILLRKIQRAKSSACSIRR